MSQKGQAGVRIQLWSYNYDPEPQGIAPLSATLARELQARGHDVLVVAAHPHYPEPVWGRRLRPYRERRDGVRVLRLPIWVGRDSGLERVRQELSFTVAQSLISPLLPPCDVMVAVTPSFPAVGPCMAISRARGIPFVLWVQDLVTDGAQTTGLLPEGRLLDAARRFERASYAAAARVVVVSEAFRSNLRGKGVPEEKIRQIYNPASLDGAASVREPASPPRVLVMGNIGLSQGLEDVVPAFEASPELEALGARLVVAGHGVRLPALRDLVRTDRVVLPGVLQGADLARELRTASVGVVSQRADVAEFNLPSKLMNYLRCGLPVVAAVRPGSETAHIVEDSGAGWVTDAARPAEFAATTARVLADPEALRRAGEAGRAFGERHFAPPRTAEAFERVLAEVAGDRR